MPLHCQLAISPKADATIDRRPSCGQHGWAGAPPGQRAGAAQQHSWAAQLLLASPLGPLASTVHSPHPALPALGGHGNMSDLNISPEPVYAATILCHPFGRL